MAKLAVIIPEFPGQTHAFFMREKAELEKLGAEIKLLSTRQPVAEESKAKHKWAQEAAKQTLYLTPLDLSGWISALSELIMSGPCAWWRCLSTTLKADVGAKEKLMMLGLVLIGAFVKQLCRKEAIAHIHVHSCANAANIALFNRLLGGTPYSMTLHGPMDDYGLNQSAKWQSASFGVVITQELLAEVNERLQGVKLPPIYLAPMGVNVEHFKRSNDYISPTKGDVVKLVSCGRIHPVKAHDDLVRAVAMLKEQGIQAELTVCGAPDSQSHTLNYPQELKALTSELDVESQIHWLGSVSEERVRQALEEAHIFCLASLKEPLGVATMEAMAMSTPAIVARSPGVEEMIHDGVDGILVNPRAPEQFTQAIQSLVESPQKANSLSIEGRKKVVRSYHSGVSAEVIFNGVVKSAS